MVERLKIAIEKARARAAMHVEEALPLTAGMAVPEPADPWDLLATTELNERRLARERIVTAGKTHPAHAEFDRLRTKLRAVLRERAWHRIAVTAPTKGCGKSVVSCNLAFSFARQPDCRVILIDMDLRAPSVARMVGITPKRPFHECLIGDGDPKEHLIRVMPNVALGLGTRSVPNSSEICQSGVALETLARISATYRPDVMLFDLPPALDADDVLGFMRNVNCTLIVSGADQTTADELVELERLLAPATNILGVVLNKSREKMSRPYGYE